MLLFILTTVLPILIGIGLMISAKIMRNKDNKEHGWDAYSVLDYIRGSIGLGLVIVFGIALFIESILLFCNRLPSFEQLHYEDMVEQREILEYRLENEDATLNGNNELYNDVLYFNKDLRKHKTYSDSIWIGCFFNQKIHEIEYIELSRDK